MCTMEHFLGPVRKSQCRSKFVVDQQVIAHSNRRNSTNVETFEKNQRNYYPCANDWIKDGGQLFGANSFGSLTKFLHVIYPVSD